MKTAFTYRVDIASRRSSRLAAYTTLAGATLAVSAAAPVARAAIVWSGPIFINIPSDIDGIYLNVVTGIIGTSGASVSGWDVNPYGASSLTMFSTTGTAYSGSGASYFNLDIGTFVGPATQFTNQNINNVSPTTPLHLNSSLNYIGFHFNNETTG